MHIFSRHISAGVVSLLAFASAGAAQATSITVTDLGTVSANTANSSPVGSGVSIAALNDAPIVLGTTVKSSDGGTGIGWNPYGTSNASAYWISVGGASDPSGTSSATFNFSTPTNALEFVWGSASYSNTVTLYSGAGGTGHVVGSVSADGNGNLYINTTNYVASAVALQNANLANTTNPGAIIEIASSVQFASAVFSTGANTGGFEVGGISAVPVPAALPLFGAALAGLGGLGFRRRRKTASV